MLKWTPLFRHGPCFPVNLKPNLDNGTLEEIRFRTIVSAYHFSDSYTKGYILGVYSFTPMH